MSYESTFECISTNLKVSNATDTCDEEDEVNVNLRCRCPSAESSSSRCCYDKSCISIATQVECIKCDMSRCQNQNFMKRKQANLLVKDTVDKGFGLFTNEDLKSGQFIIEFVGELINIMELIQRRREYDGHLLVMQLKEGSYLDATKKGSISRFLNHSCEPNCRIEVWNVNNVYRIGAFPIRNITEGEELTIDYEWEPSAKEFTKCHCNSKSCRGYIELIDYAQYSNSSNNQLYDFKNGVWLSPKNVPEEAMIKSVDDNSTLKVDPSWLIGKRVKVWWSGNQQYFDTDVVDYLVSKKKHLLKYIDDNKLVEEVLYLSLSLSTQSSSSSVDTELRWLWLDESRKEVVIKKKLKDDSTVVIDEGMLELSPAKLLQNNPYSFNLSSTVLDYGINNSSNGNSNNISKLSMTFTAIDPRNMKSKTYSLGRDVAYFICMQSGEEIIISRLHQNLMDLYELQNTTMQLLSFHFAVKIYLPQATKNLFSKETMTTTNTSSSAGSLDSDSYLNNDEDKIRVVISGIESNVLNVLEYLNQSQSKLLQLKTETELLKRDTWFKRQSAIMTNDWRKFMPLSTFDEFLSHCNVSNNNNQQQQKQQQNGSNGYINYFASIYQKLKDMPNVYNNDIFFAQLENTNQLPTSKHMIQRHRHICTCISTTATKLKFSTMVTLHATTIYLRYSRFNPEEIQIDLNDDVLMVVSCIMLSLKARQEFKLKIMTKLIPAAYCIVFNRDEDITSSSSSSLNSNNLIDMYIKRLKDKESHIWNALRNDIYLCDIKSTILSHYSLNAVINVLQSAPSHSKSITNHKSSSEKHVKPSHSDKSKSGRHNSSSNNVSNDDKCSSSNNSESNIVILEQFTELSLSLCILISTKYSWFYETCVSADIMNFSIVLFVNVIVVNLIGQSESQNSTACASSSSIVSLTDGMFMLFYKLAAQGCMGMSIDLLLWMVESLLIFFSTIALDKFQEILSNSPLISSIMPSSTTQQSLSLSPQFFQQVYQIFHESKSILNSTDISQYILTNYQPIRCNKRFPVFHPTADNNSSNNVNMLQQSDVIQEQNLTHEFNVLLVSATEQLMTTSFIAHTAPHMIKKASKSKSIDASSSSSSIDGDTYHDLLPIGLNSIPSQKQLHRENRGKTDADTGYLSNFALSEIVMLQQIHDLYPKSSTVEYCPYYILPVGSYTVSILTNGNFIPSSLLNNKKSKKLMHTDASDTTSWPGGSIQRLFLITNPLYISLNEVLQLIAENKHSSNYSAPLLMLGIDFITALVHDVYSAIYHCTMAGIVFKWINLDQVYLSLEGHIVFSGLDGAVYMHSTANTDSIVQKAKPVIAHEHKKRKKNGKDDHDDKNNTDGNGVVDENLKPIVTSHYLSHTAPEIILGSKATSESCVFIAGTLCALILTGKSLIKRADTEEKQMQYIYRVLGTPKVMKYHNFQDLARANHYGGNIKADDGSLKENRSQVPKMILEASPQYLKVLFADNKSLSSSSEQYALRESNLTDNIFDIICGSLCLVPCQRLSLADIISASMFSSDRSIARMNARSMGIHLVVTGLKNKGIDCNYMYPLFHVDKVDDVAWIDQSTFQSRRLDLNLNV